MGRKIGFIPAAARLADPKREIPLLIILPESLSKNDYQGNLEFITKRVNEKLKKQRRCIVVIGEGVNVGNLGILRDSFGHAQFSASESTVEQALINYLNGTDRKDNQGRAQSRLIVKGIAPYKVNYDKILLDTVANSEREFPKKWIASNRVDVTDEFIEWALPLIGTPLPQFAKFKEIYIAKKCGEYVPVGYRSK
jgi:6-phosphofructokinase 1